MTHSSSAHRDPLRWRLPVAGLIGAVLIATVTRIALALRSPDAVFDGLAEVVRVFSVGLVFDLGTAAFLVLPLVLYAWLAPRRLGHRLYRAGAIALLFPFLWGLSFVALAEFLFWDEFSARFNFIAVDYLIYTREVAGNIWQSYPVVPLLAGVTVIAALACAGLARFALRTGPAAPSLFRRARWALPLIAAPVIVYAALDSRNHEISGNVALNQLAGNGVFEFFAAIRNNELNYTAFYATRPLAEAFAELKQELAGPGIRFTSDAPFAFEHEVTAAGPEKHLNVVLVSVESLSAEFLGAYGDTHGLTHNLDRLARESLVFTRTYATGTRTVRGLEALSLSIPPTPGISIVRRPNNEGLFSLGHLLGSRGYDSMYVYGGYGYFDNMNAFFGTNGYKVVDRMALKSEDIHHETIWGVADEDLFTLALREVDASHAAGKPFFAHVMTTSNHRPYTYPEGRIDIPSGTGREGAVKYTDWAIGRFLEEARSRPWFDDTVFVIVADHCAAARGKTELPPDRYHIPLIVYSPRHVQPGRFDYIVSQIDVPPTIAGLLNLSYRSKFFGQDALRMAPKHERAFIANFQTLGYLEGGRLVELRPQRRVRVLPGVTPFAPDPASDDALVEEAVSQYEAASQAFRQGWLRVGVTPPAMARAGG